MDQLPDEITLCQLECVLMPNGEVICMGKTVGWFIDLKSYLEAQQENESAEAGIDYIDSWYCDDNVVDESGD